MLRPKDSGASKVNANPKVMPQADQRFNHMNSNLSMNIVIIMNKNVSLINNPTLD